MARQTRFEKTDVSYEVYDTEHKTWVTRTIRSGAPYDKYDADKGLFYREPFNGCREYEPVIDGVPAHCTKNKTDE